MRAVATPTWVAALLAGSAGCGQIGIESLPRTDGGRTDYDAIVAGGGNADVWTATRSCL